MTAAGGERGFLSRPYDSSRFAAQLVESDRRYFEAGAIVESVGGAVLACLPGLEALPAGCTVLRIDGDRIGDADEWLASVESRTKAIGARMSIATTSSGSRTS